MSEPVRLLLHEANDVRKHVRDFLNADHHGYPIGPHDANAEDLVNRIGEIYEKALARKGQVQAERSPAASSKRTSAASASSARGVASASPARPCIAGVGAGGRTTNARRNGSGPASKGRGRRSAMGIGDIYADKDEREARNLRRDRGGSDVAGKVEPCSEHYDCRECAAFLDACVEAERARLLEPLAVLEARQDEFRDTVVMCTTFSVEAMKVLIKDRAQQLEAAIREAKGRE